MPGSHPDPSTLAALITTVTSVISPPTNIITYNLATSAGTVTSTVTSTIVIPLSSITTTVTSIISPQTNTITSNLATSAGTVTSTIVMFTVTCASASIARAWRE